jgi:predicted chitinase/peptidoglycan hydrolase-like protein with peptidoglycan-binding domain
MTYSLTWLPQVLRGAGLKVAEVPGWADRGRGEMGQVLGVICHHTGTPNPNRLNMPTLGMIRDGRSDLAGPLAQLGLGLDGTFYVVAAGRSNHAGAGEWRGVSGNSRFIGIEAENGGTAADQPWPDVQMDAYRRGVAAILARIGATSDMCCGHKEYAPGRKPDPLFDMKAFRDGVAAIMRGTVATRPLIAAASASGRPTVRRGSRGDAVAELQRAVGALPADGVFGPATEAKLRQFQRLHALVADGIAGPATWEAIDDPPPLAAGDATIVATLTEPGAAAGAAIAAGGAGAVSLDMLAAVAPRAPRALLESLVAPMSAACTRFGIDTPLRKAAFLSQCAHESGGFTRREENLSYRAERLMQVWPKRFPTIDVARRFARMPERLANNVYGGRMGNGDAASGDGWRFRGRGFKQLTGRSNYTAFAAAIGKTLDEVTDYALTDEGACLSAAWFWASNKLNGLADKKDIRTLTERINGGLNGLAEREALFKLACAAIERAPAPAILAT